MAKSTTADSCNSLKHTNKMAQVVNNNHTVQLDSTEGFDFDRIPIGEMRSIADSLTKTERALFAVALTASSFSWENEKYEKEPSKAAKVVINMDASRPADPNATMWQKLDFSDLGHNIASKLTDGDIGGILVCIDARNVLKKLKLTHCTGITGLCLVPLRGSIVLKQLDLSLVEQHAATAIPSETMLSQKIVLPILDSIIETQNSSLAHLQLPKTWRSAQRCTKRYRVLSAFLEKYNRLLISRAIVCLCCEGAMMVFMGTDQNTSANQACPLISQEDEFFGLQPSTCYECMDHICPDCKDHVGFDFCRKCEKSYCFECNFIGDCEECHEISCTGCTNISTCEKCDKTTCNNCCPTFYCESCETERCVKCAPFQACQTEWCSESFCIDCQDECEECHKKECPECATINTCDECEKTTCEKCCPINYCESCEKDRCIKCTPFNSCQTEWCSESFCMDCQDECEECHKKECPECATINTCDECEKTSCDKCCPIFYCERCDRHRCVKCASFNFCQTEGCWTSNCMDCAEKFDNPVIRCDHCEESYCALCQPMELCESHGTICTKCHKDQCKFPTTIVVNIYDEPICCRLRVLKDDQLRLLMGNYSEKIGKSLRSIRLIHKGSIDNQGKEIDKSFFGRDSTSGNDKNIFLTSSKNKTMTELGIANNDFIEVRNLISRGSHDVVAHSNCMVKSSTVAGSKSKKNRPRKKKSKNRPLNLKLKTTAIDDREDHSKKLSLVFQESEELFKETRQFLNAMNLERTPPKQKSSPGKSAPKVSRIDNFSNDCIGCKAGKSRFVVQVGEVENLYKTRKPSVLCKHNAQDAQPLLLDLHGYTREEALSNLDSSLIQWIDVAMRGSYPWVIPVIIVCGGGNQILSEAVEYWIKQNDKVSNAPKNFLG